MDMVTKSNAAGGGGAKRSDIEQELYAKREKIYPREVHGLFASLRALGVFVLLGLYYGLPWLSWDGRQAVLLDLPARQFHIFAITFWPQDFFYLAVLLIIAGLSLFFFTALAGRLWCGYACPQTVWTEVFLWIERKIEGDRPKQIKLDKAPWSMHKLLLKGTKHSIWILFSLYTGFTFVGYFTPIDELAQQLISVELGPWQSFWILFYSFATYGNAGWMREQVCIYMCPYARFQSAMFDNNTLIISYEQKRGEPRGSRRRSADPRSLGLGDCIDCGLCVQVCPTGIDIRDGLQYECIGCAGCVDVCNQVMEKMHYPQGLIRYTTQLALHDGSTRILRPRIFVYAAILLVSITALGLSIGQRIPLELDVIRDRNALYRETSEGRIENIYTLKIINKDRQSHRYHLAVSGAEGLQLINKVGEINAASGEVLSIPVSVQIDPLNLNKTSMQIHFHIAALEREQISQSEPARFLGPVVR